MPSSSTKSVRAIPRMPVCREAGSVQARHRLGAARRPRTERTGTACPETILLIAKGGASARLKQAHHRRKRASDALPASDRYLKAQRAKSMDRLTEVRTDSQPSQNVKNDPGPTQDRRDRMSMSPWGRTKNVRFGFISDVRRWNTEQFTSATTGGAQTKFLRARSISLSPRGASGRMAFVPGGKHGDIRRARLVVCGCYG